MADIADVRIDEANFARRKACPACDGTAWELLYACALDADPVRGFIADHYRAQGRVDWTLLSGTDFAVAECPDCSLIFQIAEPRPHLLEDIYTRMITPDILRVQEQGMLNLANFQEVAGELAVLFAMTGKHPSAISMLDFGFGYGRWARVARAMGAQVFVTEIGEDKARIAAEIGVRMIADEDVNRMRFDIVHTEQVFEHLTAPRPEFLRLARVTDCVFKVAVPRGGPVRELLQSQGMANTSGSAAMIAGQRPSKAARAYLGIQPLEHLNMFAPRTMERLATDAGMRIASRTRRGVTTLDPYGAGKAIRSGLRLAKSLARELVRPNTGYYLFVPG